MLYSLLHPFARFVPAFNVFRYITFRTAMAAVTALFLALALGPPMIRLLKRRQIGQSIREEGPKSHLSKAGTPTMGGLLILLAVIVATLLWMDLSNRFVWIALGTMIALGAVGFADDFVKFTRRRSLGLTGRGKLLPQILVAVAMSPKRWVILTGGLLGIVMMRLVIGTLLSIVERYPPLVDGAFVIIAWVGLKLFVEYLHAEQYLAFEIPKWLSLGLIVMIFGASYVYARRNERRSTSTQRAAERLLAEEEQS